jgi:hypothetical protein
MLKAHPAAKSHDQKSKNAGAMLSRVNNARMKQMTNEIRPIFSRRSAMLIVKGYDSAVGQSVAVVWISHALTMHRW